MDSMKWTAEQAMEAIKVHAEERGSTLPGFILQTARIYSGASGKVLGWRPAVGLHCKFNRCAV